MFPWDDLRYLLAIAREGSLAGAARSLGVNHSTAFRRLHALEAQLGVRLFERLPEGYVTTPEGETIRRHAEQVEDAVLALERTVAGADYRLSGRVRLTTPAGLAQDYVAPLLPTFRVQHPDIEVEIAVSDTDFDLARREADLALRATSQPPEFLVGRKVADLDWCFMASPDYIAKRGRPQGVDALHDHDLIGASDSFRRVSAFAWLERQCGARIVARADHLLTMAAMACAGLGIAMLPSDLHRANLERLFVADTGAPGQLWLLTHPDLRRVARIRAFSDFLYSTLREDPRLSGVPLEGQKRAR
ncbi:MAG TPA: LysR family transcriptional regulator [Xanthomonadaceae bacterium]|nr:LysR family transcriptional regulator [Xanthomonadaceae bacterium]